MSSPAKYEPSYSFEGFAATQPNTPLPGVQIDIQLDAIAQASVEAVDAIGDVRNPDGTLKDGIVTSDSLSVDLKGQLATAVATYSAAAFAARDEAVIAATEADEARDQAVSYATNLDLVLSALQQGIYVQDDGLITEAATEVIDYGLITDPAD